MRITRRSDHARALPAPTPAPTSAAIPATGPEAGGRPARDDRAERPGAVTRAEPSGPGPDVGRVESRDERRAIQSPGGAPAAQVRTGAPHPAPPPVASAAAAADRTQDADLLLDVSSLTVDELTLELQASVGLDHVKLDAKGLDASLFLKASLANLVALRGEQPARPRPMDAARRAARWAAPELPGAGRSRRGDTADAATPDDGARSAADEPGAGDDGMRAVLDGVRHRAAAVAKEGGKAATVAVAGAAGGALLESRLGSRRGRPGLPKALGGRGGRGAGMPSLVSGIERAPKALIERVQQRLP